MSEDTGGYSGENSKEVWRRPEESESLYLSESTLTAVFLTPPNSQRHNRETMYLFSHPSLTWAQLILLYPLGLSVLFGTLHIKHQEERNSGDVSRNLRPQA